MPKKIGILTSGGDCAGLNAVIRAATFRAVNKYGWKIYGIKDGTLGLVNDPLNVVELKPSNFNGTQFRMGGTLLGTNNKGFPKDNGKKIDYLPFDDNEKLTPIYKQLEGWEENLMELEDLSDAPKAVHNYINWLEKTLETPISIVSVGPDRKQTLFK